MRKNSEWPNSEIFGRNVLHPLSKNTFNILHHFLPSGNLFYGLTYPHFLMDSGALKVFVEKYMGRSGVF